MPGLADQIITRFERQSEHRMELEKYVTRTSALRANLGLAAGLIVSLAGLGQRLFSTCTGMIGRQASFLSPTWGFWRVSSSMVPTTKSRNVWSGQD